MSVSFSVFVILSMVRTAIENDYPKLKKWEILRRPLAAIALSLKTSSPESVCRAVAECYSFPRTLQLLGFEKIDKSCDAVANAIEHLIDLVTEGKVSLDEAIDFAADVAVCYAVASLAPVMLTPEQVMKLLQI